MALLEFYGAECGHCLKMMPMIDRLIAEGIAIEKLETWHNEENARKLAEYDRGYCGGVPFFYNTESKHWICGEEEEETIRRWANGEKV